MHVIAVRLGPVSGAQNPMGRLLVSVRGPNEALAAAEGGAHIADVEYPASALGTPYPLNIWAVPPYLGGFVDDQAN